VSTAGSERLRVLVLGWHGSTERHLRPIARTWEALGVEARTIVPDTWRAMSRRHGWQHLGARLCEGELDERPWLAHAFSNAGFWSLGALLEAAARDAPEKLAAHRGTVLDSAPGFPERVSPLFTARFAAMAMTPSVLAAIGRTPLPVHPVVTPALGVFLGLWHLVSPGQVRFMERSQARFIARHARKPLLSIWGGADTLVLPRYVESFLARAEAGGVPVDRLYFEETGHVRHFVEHRREMGDRIAEWLARVGRT
jgi:hypothetical protein